MSEQFNEIVEETYIETLENLAFVFSDKMDKEEALEMLDDSEFYLSSMTFSGGLEGRLKLATVREVGGIIAENMLGGVEDGNENLYIDSLKEITNVICGKLVTEIAGTEPIIDLSVPEVTTIDRENFKEMLTDKGSLVFNSEEYLVVVIFKIEKK